MATERSEQSIYMKRHGNLFEKIIDKDNLRLAHKNARKGKTHYTDVQMVDSDVEYYVDLLHEKLATKAYQTSEYTTKQVHEPKERTIYKLPYFPDRIVHHAIMNVLQPLWDRTFIYDLYSAIPGKGIHAGSYRLRKFLRDKENTTYCLKFDISKYYPSINHDTMVEIVQRKIKCKDTLWLLEEIIRSPEGDSNVPIGNYLSQYLSNLYLSGFDHWIKEQCGVKYYIRYCDDGVILHKSKRFLEDLLIKIKLYLRDIHLNLNPKTVITEVDRCGIDFLGYKHHRHFTLLRKSSCRKYKQKMKAIAEEGESVDPQHVISSVMSYVGWLKHCDSRNLLLEHTYTEELFKITEIASRELGITNPIHEVVT